MFASIQRVIHTLHERSFLFQQLVHRDFQQRYKRTALGMVWSVLSPLLTQLVMMLVFTNIFGRNVNHYIVYLFSGNIVMGYFRESTGNGMRSLMSNAKIITKINVPKYLFILSKSVSCLINFLLTICVYFVFCKIDHVVFTPRILLLIYPVITLTILGIGVGMILSALYVFFRDIEYLYSVFLRLLTYLSAIFYTLDKYSPEVQRLFLLNPVYVHIKFFRVVMIDCMVPSLQFRLLMAGYALFYLTLGAIMYKKYNHQFVYYL